MTQYISRIARRAVFATAISFVLSLGVALAGTVRFDFEADSDQSTTFTTTNNGVSATFSSPAGPLGFFVLPSSSLFLTLTGNALFQATTDDITLNVLFDQDLQYVQLLFGSTAPAQLTLTAFAQDLSQVGQTSATSAFLSASTNPEGSISFGGSAFRSLDLTFTSSGETATFAIDDLTNTPEPATPLLFGFGAIMLGCTHKLRRLRP